EDKRRPIQGKAEESDKKVETGGVSRWVPSTIPDKRGGHLRLLSGRGGRSDSLISRDDSSRVNLFRGWKIDLSFSASQRGGCHWGGIRTVSGGCALRIELPVLIQTLEKPTEETEIARFLVQ
ncbi:hypothetical protein AVEN_19517-1, partial [Araneus ventricosus]